MAFRKIRLKGKKNTPIQSNIIDQLGLCPKVTLKIKLKNCQTILSMYCAEKFYCSPSILSVSFFSSQNRKQTGIGVRRIKHRLLKCSFLILRVTIGQGSVAVRIFILCLPIAQGELARHISSGGSLLQLSSLPGKLCPQVCTELTPSCH